MDLELQKLCLIGSHHGTISDLGLKVDWESLLGKWVFTPRGLVDLSHVARLMGHLCWVWSFVWHAMVTTFLRCHYKLCVLPGKAEMTARCFLCESSPCSGIDLLTYKSWGNGLVHIQFYVLNANSISQIVINLNYAAYRIYLVRFYVLLNYFVIQNFCLSCLTTCCYIYSTGTPRMSRF